MGFRRERLELYHERHGLLVQQIGMVAMAWAGLEMSLDGSIALIHRNGGAGAIQPQLPASLKVKLEYLRKAPRKLSAIAHLADEANSVSAQVQTLKEIRHDCIHGLVLLDPMGFSVFFLRYQYEGSNLKVREAKMTQDQVNGAVKDTMTLYRTAALLFGNLATAFDDKEAIEVFGRVSIGLAAIAVEQENQARALIDKGAG